MTDLVLAVKLTGDGSDLVGEVRVSRKELDGLARSTEAQGKAADRAAGSADRYGRELRDTGREASRFNTIQTNLARTLATTAGTLLGGAGIAALSRSFIDAASTSESLETRLQILLGSAEEGSRLFGEMADYASRVPFEFREIMTAATQLAGVMSGGVDDVVRWMPLIGDLAAAAGLTIQETTEQVVRMLSAGAASADLFRERGILAMLGFQAGVSYSADETKNRLLAAWEDGASKFRGATEQLADDWTGLMSMFGDRWFAFRNQVADAGLFDAVKGEAQELLDTLNALADDGTFQAWAESISDGLLMVAEHGDEAVIAITGLLAARTLGPMLASLTVGTIGFARALNSQLAVALVAARLQTVALTAGANALRSTLAFLGGPAGLVITGATALAIWASNAADAEGDTDRLRQRVDQLADSYQRLSKDRLAAAVFEVQDAIRLLEDEERLAAARLETLFKQPIRSSEDPAERDRATVRARADLAAATEALEAKQQLLADMEGRLASLQAGTTATTQARTQATAEQIKEIDKLRKAGKALLADLFPEQAAFDDYAEKLNLISKLRQQGIVKTAAEEQEAIDRLTDQYLDLGEEGEKAAMRTSSAVTDAMRLVDQSISRTLWAAEDAFVRFARTGKLEVRDLVNVMLDEFLRLNFRKNIAGSAASMLSGVFDFSGSYMGSSLESAMFDVLPFDMIGNTFGTGGVMTRHGPLPLRYYDTGGVVNSPQVRVAGERYRPEAIVPLPDGRAIPVEMRGTSGGLVFSPTYQIDARGADAAVEGRIRSAMRETEQRTLAELQRLINRGGQWAKLTGRRTH